VAAKGLSPLPTQDGLEALKVVRDNRADLLISDIHVPGLDGFQLCRMLEIEGRRRLRKIPVILVSPAYHDEMVTRMARAAGAWICV
jgi:CheY-like chemotaxis protein